MAQIVGYFENYVTYTEGPFVLVEINGWRIEVELKGHKCPVLPNDSIYDIMELLGWPIGKSRKKELAVCVCNELNRMVRDGEIILQNGQWVAKEKV